MGERHCPSCSRTFAAEVARCPVDGTPLVEAAPELGSDPYLKLTIAEDLRLEQLIGTGAMGRVYRAHQLSQGRDVAVKVLHRELLSNETLIKRFHQEATVASRISHPGVIQVYLTGTLPRDTRTSGEAYLVMEHLAGVSLEAALTAAGGALPPPRALHVMLQVSDAVGEAHAHQIVHRDIKPENVMLIRQGSDPDFVKVLDFGVARADLGEDSIATHTGAVFGSARYVSPEGARGERVGPAADVYSLATLLFRCLAGRTPFDGDNPVAVLIQHSSRPAPDIRSFERCRALPAPIAELIAQNLTKHPEAREPNGRAFAQALAKAIDATAQAEGPISVATTRVLTVIDHEPVAGLAEHRAPSSEPLGGPGSTQLIEPELPAPARATELLEPSSEQRSSPEPEAPDRGSLSPIRPHLTRPSTPTASPAGTFDASPQSAPPMQRTSAPPPSGPLSAPSTQRTSTPPPSGPFSAPPPSGPFSAPPPSGPFSAPLSAPAGRRTLVWLLCFALGAGLALMAAFGLGVFERRKLSPESYVAQANAALEAGRLSEPPDDNVRDLTDAALRHWPRHPGLLEARRRAAARALDDARAAIATPELARQHGRLAVELDPDLESARQLVRQLDAQLEPLPPPELPSAEPPARRPTPKWVPAAPASTAPSTPPSAAQEPPAPAPGPSGGRWL